MQKWMSEPHLHAFALLLVNTFWSKSELSTLLLLVLSSSPSLIIYCYMYQNMAFLVAALNMRITPLPQPH